MSNAPSRQSINTRIIGIGGGTGSGKSCVTRILQERIGRDKAAVILLDSYYLCRSHLTTEERAVTNYDHPDALDWDLLVNHIDELLKGKTISAPLYDFATHTRSPQKETIAPLNIILIEGILALHDQRLLKLYHSTIFMDAPGHVRYERRLARDIKERGRTPESVLLQWNDTVNPMHEQFCEPTKKHAQHVIDGTQIDESVYAKILASII